MADVSLALPVLLNPYFDTSEVQSLIQAMALVQDNPRIATTSDIGAVKKLNDPGTIPLGSPLDFVISYLNTLRDGFIAAGMLEPGAGGSS